MGSSKSKYLSKEEKVTKQACLYIVAAYDRQVLSGSIVFENNGNYILPSIGDETTKRIEKIMEDHLLVRCNPIDTKNIWKLFLVYSTWPNPHQHRTNLRLLATILNHRCLPQHQDIQILMLGLITSVPLLLCLDSMNEVIQDLEMV